MNKCSGQVMLLTITVLSGTFLTATALIGFLIIHEIRQATDIANSTKAIFAADTGIEWELYRSFKYPASPRPHLTNETTFDTFVEGNSIRSIGRMGNTARAFEVTF